MERKIPNSSQLTSWQIRSATLCFEFQTLGFQTVSNFYLLPLASFCSVRTLEQIDRNRCYAANYKKGHHQVIQTMGPHVVPEYVDKLDGVFQTFQKDLDFIDCTTANYGSQQWCQGQTTQQWRTDKFGPINCVISQLDPVKIIWRSCCHRRPERSGKQQIISQKALFLCLTLMILSDIERETQWRHLRHRM